MTMIRNLKNKLITAGTGVTLAALSCPSVAMAVSTQEIMTKILNMLKSGVGVLGAILIVMGAVNLGLTIKDGMQGGGGQLAGALAMLIGGAIVTAAAVYFASIDTSWISG